MQTSLLYMSEVLGFKDKLQNCELFQLKEGALLSYR
jgi:hypothetical protein